MKVRFEGVQPGVLDLKTQEILSYPFPLYTIMDEGHEAFHSTVSDKTLKQKYSVLDVPNAYLASLFYKKGNIIRLEVLS